MQQSRTILIDPDSSITALRSLNQSARLLALYEYGVEGCAERNREQVTAVLEELISILDFKYGEIAEGFYRVYSFCLRKSRKRDFDQVAWILRELRDTWALAVADAPAGTVVPITGQAPRADGT